MSSKAQFLECCSVFVWINVLYRTILLMRLVYNKKGVLGTPFPSDLELEVNERAGICAHELVNHEDDERCCRHHSRNRERCKRDAVTGFHALRNPVDKHTRDEHENDIDVFPSDGEDGIPTPGRSHLVHHVLSRVPCDFVCFCRVEV